MDTILKASINRIRRVFKTRYLIFKDNLDVFMGFRHPLIPPKRYDYINMGANENIGKEFLHHFVSVGKLKPSDCVLEIGSGFGRMAIPLTGFLTKKGSYDGLEIIKDGINWCQSKFTPKYSNFKFQHIDVYNERYNPKGKYKASEFQLPFKDDSFNFIYLTSVFTHMFAEDVENYLSETCRILKKGGICFITYFILNKVSLYQIDKGQSAFSFKHKLKNYSIEDSLNPEYAVAYTETNLKDLYDKYGFSIVEPICYGNWSGRGDHLSFQDIIIAQKYD